LLTALLQLVTDAMEDYQTSPSNILQKMELSSKVLILTLLPMEHQENANMLLQKQHTKTKATTTARMTALFQKRSKLALSLHGKVTWL